MLYLVKLHLEKIKTEIVYMKVHCSERSRSVRDPQKVPIVTWSLIFTESDSDIGSKMMIICQHLNILEKTEIKLNLSEFNHHK